MKITESSNPAKNGFKNTKAADISAQAMTAKGSTNKTLFLLAILIISSLASWKIVAANPSLAMPFMWGGLIVGFIVAIVTVFKPNISPITGPIYAVVEGGVVGTLTLMFESSYPGIGLQALFITVGIFVGMLLLYGYRIIRVTDKFKKIVVGLTFGIMIVYLISIIANLFGTPVPYIHEGGAVGIGFSLFVIAIAAMNLLLDFNFIEEGEKNRLPQYMEWFGAFMLLVTIIWLYLEVLKLLAKVRGD